MKASEIYRLAATEVYGHETGPSTKVMAAMDAIEFGHAIAPNLLAAFEQIDKSMVAVRAAIAEAKAKGGA